MVCNRGERKCAQSAGRELPNADLPDAATTPSPRLKPIPLASVGDGACFQGATAKAATGATTRDDCNRSFLRCGRNEPWRGAGIDVALAVERDPHAARTYSANHPGTPVFSDDVRQLSSRRIRSIAKRGPTIVLGGLRARDSPSQILELDRPKTRRTGYSRNSCESFVCGSRIGSFLKTSEAL